MHLEGVAGRSGIGFGAALARAVRLSFRWRGRASRAEFWYFFLAYAPVVYVDSSSTVDVYANAVSGTREATKAGIGAAVEDCSESRLLSGVRVFATCPPATRRPG